MSFATLLPAILQRGIPPRVTLPRAILLAASLLPGCDRSAAPLSAVTTRADTVDGVVIARNTGIPPSWSLEERITLGAPAGAADGRDDVFGRIVGVAADDAGRIYVADASVPDIRVFDANGEFVRSLGRQGQGPGEYARLQSIAWVGDMLGVLDNGNGRLGLFSRDGEWLGQRQYMPMGGTDVRLHVTGRGEAYMPFVAMVGGRAGLVFVRQLGRGAADTLPARLDATGRVVSSAREARARAPRTQVICTYQGGDAIGVYSADLAPRAITVPAPDALRAATTGGDYRIAFGDPRGDTVRIVERTDVRADPVSDAEWREEERKFAEYRDGIPDETCDPPDLPRPEVRRLIVGIWFDTRGRTWIERESEGSRAFDVFQPDGRLIAQLPSPQRLDRVPPFIDDQTIYLVVTDQLDVEYVKAFAIQR